MAITNKTLESTDYRTARVYPDAYYDKYDPTKTMKITLGGANWEAIKTYKERVANASEVLLPAPISDGSKPFFSLDKSVTVSSVNIPNIPRYGLPMASGHSFSKQGDFAVAIPFAFLDQDNDGYPIRVEIYTNDKPQHISSLYTLTYSGDKVTGGYTNLKLPKLEQCTSKLFVSAITATTTTMDLIYVYRASAAINIQQSYVARDDNAHTRLQRGVHPCWGQCDFVFSINGADPVHVEVGQTVWKAISQDTISKESFRSLPPIRPFTISYEAESGDFVCWRWLEDKQIYYPLAKYDALTALGSGQLPRM